MEPIKSANPFSVPAARVSDAVSDEQGALLSEARALDAGRGVSWVGGGWGLYREATGMWVGLILILGVIFIVLSLIPLVNLLVSLIMPVFVGGLMIGCRDLERGEGLELGHLFAGFRDHFGQLVLAGLIYGVGAFVIMAGVMFAMVGSMGLSVMAGGQPAGMDPAPMLMALLVAMALIIPMVMTIWFAPALIVLHDLPAVEAMILSFKGCLRNILPFLLYGVVLVVLGFFASIPLMLGWLVLGPVMITSQYSAYRDIFIE
jgi:hypothetical protein